MILLVAKLNLVMNASDLPEEELSTDDGNERVNSRYSTDQGAAGCPWKSPSCNMRRIAPSPEEQEILVETMTLSFAKAERSVEGHRVAPEVAAKRASLSNHWTPGWFNTDRHTCASGALRADPAPPLPLAAIRSVTSAKPDTTTTSRGAATPPMADRTVRFQRELRRRSLKAQANWPVLQACCGASMLL
jgi:hypothetical protein